MTQSCELKTSMPIQVPQWTEFLSCPVCCHEFDNVSRFPISLACGHTICRGCLSKLHRRQCPFDQSTVVSDLPINTALLKLLGSQIPDTERQPSSVNGLDDEAKEHYFAAKRCIEDLALYVKPSSGGGGCLLSRPMQRKLVTLLNCQLVEEEGRARAVRAARSIGERTVIELMLQHQNPQQLSTNLWASVRARGCQFLGPAMQEEVLKLVLLALEDGSALSRKVLVMFIVQRLEPHFSQASKTSIGHVVQLLYRASCFKVSKREGDSSLMQLKDEFRTYESLRREHDAQIVQIANEAGLRIAPDQWSSLLYGDTAHKSHMQSIIDKLQTPASFAQSVQELTIALQRTGDPGNLSSLRRHFELLATIDPSTDFAVTSWENLDRAMLAVRVLTKGLVGFIQSHGSKRMGEGNVAHPPGLQPAKYKTSLCRDLAQKGGCPRGTTCTFAHSQEELERYRNKSRRLFTTTSMTTTATTATTTTTIPPPKATMNKTAGTSTLTQATCSFKTRETNSISRADPPLLPTKPPVNTEKHNGGTPAIAVPVAVPYPLDYAAVGVPHIYPQFMGMPFQPPPDYFPGSPAMLLNQSLRRLPPNMHMQFPPEVIKNEFEEDYMDVEGSSQLAIRNQSVSLKRTPTSMVTKSLVALEKRKSEILEQLEKVIGKSAVNSLASSITTSGGSVPAMSSMHMRYSVAERESMARTQIVTQYNPQYVNAGFVPQGGKVHSTIAMDDDEYIPFEGSLVSRFGPISRGAKTLISHSVHSVQVSASMDGNTLPTRAMKNPVPAISPTLSCPSDIRQPSSGLYTWNPATDDLSNSSIINQALIGSKPLSDEKNLITVGHGILDPPQVQSRELNPLGYRPSDPSPLVNFKDGRFLAESEAVRLELQQLEERISELQLATNSEALTKELRLIDQGIQEKCREMELVSEGMKSNRVPIPVGYNRPPCKVKVEPYVCEEDYIGAYGVEPHPWLESEWNGLAEEITASQSLLTPHIQHYPCGRPS